MSSEYDRDLLDEQAADIAKLEAENARLKALVDEARGILSEARSMYVGGSSHDQVWDNAKAEFLSADKR